MKKLFFLLACVAMSVLSFGQDNQLVWANGRLLYGTPIESVDSLTYDEMQDIDTLHLLLPRTLIKVVHDTVYIHDTVYVETGSGDEDDTSSAGIGVFSVFGKEVTFSKGNLQYHPANDEWRFAENQSDCIGNANSNIAADYDGWIDLFGWGTGDAPTKSSTSNSDYSTFVDWGTNQIGSDAPNTWRTLTYDEWYSLLYTRTNANDLCGVAQVNGVNGLILLPDNWTCPSGVSFKSGFHSEWGVEYYAAYQTFTAAEWSKLEAAGAVFLPASGYRGGYYWSATGWYENISSFDVFGAYCLTFGSGGADVNLDDRYSGLSVRLVKDLQ